MELNDFGIRPIDLMQEKGRTVLIYGKAGVGKTTLLNTLKGHILVINIDCGEQVLDTSKNFDICTLVSRKLQNPIDSVNKLESFIDYLMSEESLDWDYIVDSYNSDIDIYFYMWNFSSSSWYECQTALTTGSGSISKNCNITSNIEQFINVSSQTSYFMVYFDNTAASALSVQNDYLRFTSTYDEITTTLNNPTNNKPTTRKIHFGNGEFYGGGNPTGPQQ